MFVAIFRKKLGSLPVALLWVVFGLWADPCRAEEAPSKHAWLDPLSYPRLLRDSLGKIRQPEIVEMAVAIANGSDMGPGDGWFHGSQTRFGWNWLTARYDLEHKGKISREDFAGPKDLFDRLDRNHDGVLTSNDFDWSDRSLYALQGMPARFWFSRIDTNSNGRISREDWYSHFERMSQGKEYVTPDDLREAFPTVPPPRPSGSPPPTNDGPSPLILAKGLLTGELGSFYEGPDIGQKAPDFALKTQDGKQVIRLSRFLGAKPDVLVFGSFT
jgi:Ca2+-binding EF-hand superfamily protein